MARKNTIRLLLVNASDNDSERLVSLFRAAGRVARAERVAAADGFAQALQQQWDLLILDDNHPELDVETCLGQVQDKRVDFPVIVLRAGADLAALFSAGARDVVDPADDQRLICAAVRELDTVELRRNVGKLQKQVQEAEERNALLLGEADQAIAYVADGMVINANPLFAERFGYADPGDLDCVPIIDLIAANDHEKFKAVLKSGESAELAFSGQRADGEAFQALLRLNPATYDGDPCTQLIIENRASGGGGGSSERDDDTGLYSRSYLVAQINGHNNGSLAVISIDHFAQLRRQLGYSKSGSFVAELAAFIAQQEPPADATLARIGDDTVALFSQSTSADDALEWARQLCRAVEGHIIEPDGQSLQCTISVGIAPVGGVTPAELLDRAWSTCEKVRIDAGRDGIGNGAASFVPERGKRPVRTEANQHRALDDALEASSFALLFQPIISLRGASGEHYEALLRMRGDTDALELPDNFLDTIGVSAGNAKLDRWILLEATKSLAENRGRGNDTRLVINLTANALQDEGLAPWLGVALKAAGLPASTLILQLREIDVINYLKPARAFAEAVQQLGCRLSISGFGKMMDPLKTLKNVPANLVQVDGSFTRELQTSGDAQALKSLVTSAGAQDVQVIIPFVENASVLATLWQVGADFIQGHYLQAPSREMNYEFTDIA